MALLPELCAQAAIDVTAENNTLGLAWKPVRMSTANWKGATSQTPLRPAGHTSQAVPLQSTSCSLQTRRTKDGLADVPVPVPAHVAHLVHLLHTTRISASGESLSSSSSTAAGSTHRQQQRGVAGDHAAEEERDQPCKPGLVFIFALA